MKYNRTTKSSQMGDAADIRLVSRAAWKYRSPHIGLGSVSRVIHEYLNVH